MATFKIPNTPDCLIYITSYLANTVSIFVDRVNTLEITSAYPRFVSRLIALAGRFGVKKYGKIVIDAPITHRDIANSINMTRETASRQFERLEGKGLVEYKNRKISIRNIKRLEKELCKHYERVPI